jgi:Predicted oxidoreductases of the aldo/keto reductase family
MIPTLPFGRTGHISTRVLFGAAALSRVTQAEADRAVETLMKYGVNHIDTSESYGDSEVRLGPWIEKYRHEFFLATKTDGRTYQAAKESIQRSLERLRTDYLDLIQLHAVIEDSEWEIAMGSGGALEAAVEARQQGLVKFIGITSHSLRAPIIHQKSLARFDFDSILMPWNYQLAQNQEYAANFQAVVKTARSKNTAVQIIKTAQRRLWGDNPHWSTTWYEPYKDQKSIDLAIHWALSNPGVFINSAGDVNVMAMVMDAASRYEKPPTDKQMQELMRTQSTEPLWV